ncbi:MAG: M23 family metallopeptidase [Deltaproteobacteria bacterium]|nr:M23 family metallopeptidase [Deltaproteobacteria bacterium]
MKMISLFILSNTGAPAKKISVPGFLLPLLLIAVIAGVAGIGYLAYDYSRICNVAEANGDMAKALSAQEDLITTQRRQIQDFAGDINRLKSRLVALNNFEEKIRIIANIGTDNGQETLFGVGGTRPEDLETNIDLNRRHTSLMRDMHTQVELLQDASAVQQDLMTSLLGKLESQKSLLACTPAIRPAKGWLTSPFGFRTSPFTGRREFHKGFDIANRKGTPIVATADGVVKFVGSRRYLGNYVIIDHGHGMMTRYGHVEKALVKRGDKVKRGDLIAKMGNSGRSTGPHVHYAVYLNGVPVNPATYILN